MKLPILAFAVVVIGGLTGVMAFQPAKTLEEPQVVITGDYKLVHKIKFCVELCPALLTTGDYEVFVEYGLDGESVRYMEPLSVTKNGVEVNAYIDQSEVARINAVIVGGAR